MKVTGKPVPFQGEKRQFIPGYKLTGPCPNCGADYSRDFEDNYLSYPTINEAMEYDCYCHKCEHEWAVNIEIRLTVRLTK